MMELIKITENNGRQVVSARELYERLGFKDNNFTKFCNRYILKNEYAVQGVDYEHLVLKVGMFNGGMRETTDYALLLDFAKKICMLARTEAGDKIRQYFIEVEKKALAPRSTLDILELTIKGLREQQIELDEIKTDIKQLKAVTQSRPDVYTAAGFLTIKGITATLQLCKKIGVHATKKCNEMGWPIDKCPDPRFGAVNIYPVAALEQAYQMI